MADDWDLFAVVKSYCSSLTSTTTAATQNENQKETEKPLDCLAPWNFEEANPYLFPNPAPLMPFSPQNPAFPGVFNQLLPGPQIQAEVQPQQIPVVGNAITFDSVHSPELKSRKRKNNEKKTVRYLTVENLADSWAWRKYGQKPIKNSPYPRSYYKCSSFKGCLARKLVEQNKSDPNMFTVSYTGDHTHPKPTHRNSLAGTTRNKLSTAPKCSSSKKSTVPEAKQAEAMTTSISPQFPGPVEMVDGEIEEDEILIPNKRIDDDDPFEGLQGLSIGGYGWSREIWD